MSALDFFLESLRVYTSIAVLFGFYACICIDVTYIVPFHSGWVKLIIF